MSGATTTNTQLTADELVTSVAAMLGTQWMFQNKAPPAVTAAHVATAVSAMVAAKQVSAAVGNQAVALVGKPTGSGLITSAIAVASNVLTQRKAQQEKAATAASTHKPIATPVHPVRGPIATPVTPPVKEPIRTPVVQPVHAPVGGGKRPSLI